MSTTRERRQRRHKQETASEQPSVWRRRLPLIGLVLALVVAAGSYAYVFDEKLDLNGDNAFYYLLGRGLAIHGEYTEIWRATPAPSNHYPPGYPAFVAVVTSVHDSINTVKMANGVLFLASLALLFALFQRLQIGAGRLQLTLLATLALALNAHLLRYATIMMSEIPFLAVSTLALYATTRLRMDDPPWRDPWIAVVILSLGAAYYVRTIAIALVFGVLVFFVLKRSWRHLIVTVAGFVLLALPWYLRGRSLGGNSYLSQLLQINPYRPELGMAGPVDLLVRFWNNLSRYVTSEIPTGLFPFLAEPLQNAPVASWIVGLLLVALIVYGTMRLRAYRMLVAAYLVGTFGITLLWPDVWYGVRFIIAVVPLLTFLAVSGLYGGLRTLFEQARGSVELRPIYLAPLLLFFVGPLQDLAARAEQPYPPNWRNYFEAAAQLREQSPSGAVVSARKPSFFYLFSQRPTVRYRYSTDPDEVIADMEDRGVDYVVIDQLGFSSTPRYLVPAVQAHQNRFATIIRIPSPDTYVLRFEAR